MSKTFLSISFSALILLSACGTNEPQQNAYGYRVGPGSGPGPIPGGGVFENRCHPRVAKQWNAWIASQCNNVQSDRQADSCVAGAERFRQMNPNITCNIAVADTTWGPGGWQAQSWFEINDSVIYGIFYNYGRNSPGRRGGGWRQPPRGHGPHGPGDGHFPIPNGPGRPVPAPGPMPGDGSNGGFDDPNSL